MPARNICVGAVQSVLIWKHIWLGQESAAERQISDLQSLAVLPLPEEHRAWAGQLSDLGALSRSHSASQHQLQGSCDVIKARQQEKHCQRCCSTKRICEKGEIKETEVVGKEDYDRG